MARKPKAEVESQENNNGGEEKRTRQLVVYRIEEREGNELNWKVLMEIKGKENVTAILGYLRNAAYESEVDRTYQAVMVKSSGL